MMKQNENQRENQQGKKTGKKLIALVCAGVVAVGGGAAWYFINSANSGKIRLDPKNPEVLTVWHYYNGMQQQAFDELVKEFNDTVGMEKGIVVEAAGKGGLDEISAGVQASVNKEIGAEEMPDMFAAYSDTAYDLDQQGLLANISEYMPQEEQDQYLTSYIQEGCLSKEGELKLFPIAKSTEILLLNETAWDEFENETGADKGKLSTWEGLAELAKEYYEWTDAKTPDVEGDGQAFYGRDAFANYILIGCKQLGSELFHVEDGKMTLQIDKDVMHRLWDCYYVPYVNGWFGAYGRFRSDDIKTGQLIALVGSTSGALYFPSEVTDDSGVSHPIECGAYLVPNFEETEPYAVQQGAGMVVTKGDEKKEYACVEFLKWLTEADHNIMFSLESGYLPVKKESNDAAVIEKAMDEEQVDGLLRKVITAGNETTNTYHLYTSKAFENGNAARSVAGYHMSDAANAALQKRDELIASGESREQAIEQLTNEAAFEEWFADFEAAMEQAVDGQKK